MLRNSVAVSDSLPLPVIRKGGREGRGGREERAGGGGGENLRDSGSVADDNYPCFRIFADAIVIDSAFVAQRYGSLSGAALRLAHQETAVDARTEEILGRIPRDGAVVPNSNQFSCQLIQFPSISCD